MTYPTSGRRPTEPPRHTLNRENRTWSNMVEGRSKQAFGAWLAARPDAWRAGFEVVAMDGFTGYTSATTEQLPAAVAVMDWGHLPLVGDLHAVRLAGDALDQCRRRVQQRLHGHRGRAGGPLYRSRRMLHTGADLLTERQRDRSGALFGVPAALTEVATLGRTLVERAGDVLAYFERGTSNGPTEAVNGRLEHLRGTALGSRNLTHHIARSLLGTGGLTPRLHPRLRGPVRLGRACLGRDTEHGERGAGHDDSS